MDSVSQKEYTLVYAVYDMKAVQGMNQTQQVYQSNKIKEQLVEDWKNERLQKKKSIVLGVYSVYGVSEYVGKQQMEKQQQIVEEPTEQKEHIEQHTVENIQTVENVQTEKLLLLHNTDEKTYLYIVQNSCCLGFFTPARYYILEYDGRDLNEYELYIQFRYAPTQKIQILQFHGNVSLGEFLKNLNHLFNIRILL